MNLRPAHLLSILVGIGLGAALGYGLTFFVKPGTLPEIEKTTGTHGAGVLVGAIVGAVGSVLLLLVRAVRNPDKEPSRNITSINGTGSTLIGRSDVRKDGSYLATEWFIVLFVPVFPICRYRLTPRGRKAYAIHEKHPPTFGDTLKVYARTVAVILCLIALFVALKKLLAV